MELILTLLLILFIVSFGTYFMVGITMFIVKFFLIRRIRKKRPKIWIHKFTFMTFFNFAPLKDGIKMLLSFGDRNAVIKFNSHMFDVTATERVDDIRLNGLLRKFIFLNILFAKLWTIILATLLITGIIVIIK